MLGRTIFLIATILLPVLATPVSSNDVRCALRYWQLIFRANVFKIIAVTSAVEKRASGPVVETLGDDVAKRDALPVVLREKTSYDIVVDSEDGTTKTQDDELLDDLETRSVRGGSGNGRRVVRPGNGNGRRAVRGGSGNGRRSDRGGSGNA